MMTSSNGSMFRITGPLCGEFTGLRWIPCTKASEAQLWCFLWSAPWINGWVNNREAGNLRRHRAHYDVIVLMHVCPCYDAITVNAWWRHNMETLFALLGCLWGGSTCHLHKGPVMRSFDLSLMLSGTNCGTNPRVAGNLRRPDTDYVSNTLSFHTVWSF